MTTINAVWIDHELPFVDEMKLKLQDGFNIFHCSDLDEGSLDKILWNDVDLVLMDVKFRDQECLEFIPHLRSKKINLPIVIVTAHASKDYCVRAINLGVNGLVEKPVEISVLKGLLEKHRFKGVDLRMSNERKAVLSQDSWVDLTSTEYKILEALKTARRRLTRAELQSAVWPNSTISENNLDTHLTNLKRKIPELNQCLNVKRGLGYYLEIRT